MKMTIYNKTVAGVQQDQPVHEDVLDLLVHEGVLDQPVHEGVLDFLDARDQPAQEAFLDALGQLAQGDVLDL